MNTSEDVQDDTAGLLYDTAFLSNLRLQMLRFATQQLGNETEADDAVQEALIGALKSVKSFGGRAALKTWVFAILKNKISDTLRRKVRLAEISRLVDEEEERAIDEKLFNEKGFWKGDEQPVNWMDPETTMLNKDFWRVFEACLDHLPDQQGRVFMMREFVNLSSHEICQTVGISVSNLNVLLHRARLRLRECLENRWFVGGNAC